MQKKILSEIALYYGNVSMPKGFEIDRKKISSDILQSNLTNKKLPFSKSWDMMNTYVIEHVYLNYDLKIENKKNWGNFYKPNEISKPLINTDPMDLSNSSDFTLLYGVEVKDCIVTIYYDDNRRKGNTWNIPLENNKFIMFPSTNMYIIKNNQKEKLNFVLTTTYESF